MRFSLKIEALTAASTAAFALAFASVASASPVDDFANSVMTFRCQGYASPEITVPDSVKFAPDQMNVVIHFYTRKWRVENGAYVFDLTQLPYSNYSFGRDRFGTTGWINRRAGDQWIAPQLMEFSQYENRLDLMNTDIAFPKPSQLRVDAKGIADLNLEWETRRRSQPGSPLTKSTDIRLSTGRLMFGQKFPFENWSNDVKGVNVRTSLSSKVTWFRTSSCDLRFEPIHEWVDNQYRSQLESEKTSYNLHIQKHALDYYQKDLDALPEIERLVNREIEPLTADISKNIEAYARSISAKKQTYDFVYPILAANFKLLDDEVRAAVRANQVPKERTVNRRNEARFYKEQIDGLVTAVNRLWDVVHAKCKEAHLSPNLNKVQTVRDEVALRRTKLEKLKAAAKAHPEYFDLPNYYGLLKRLEIVQKL